jgi:threonine dehydrogenase-like Zn-dependent dehydrogenase
VLNAYAASSRRGEPIPTSTILLPRLDAVSESATVWFTPTASITRVAGPPSRAATTVEERPDPQAGPGGVVVEVIATGICGSDFHGYSGKTGRRHPGQVMGHETVGRVRELGTDVEGFAVGQLVTVDPVMSCSPCPACLSGQEHWCSQRVVLGVTPEIPAAFAERVAVPASNIVPLPEHMPEELGALVEPMAVGYHAVRRGQPSPDDRVLVIGGGPIGQACLLAARRLGVQFVALSDIGFHRAVTSVPGLVPRSLTPLPPT